MDIISPPYPSPLPERLDPSSFSSCSTVSVRLVPCLTLLFLPDVLAGVFQTLGARQEPPGVARLSPPFLPIRSGTGTQSSVSSQQQLQEDKLAAGGLADLQT